MARKQSAALKKTAFTEGLAAAGIDTGEKAAEAAAHFDRRAVHAERRMVPIAQLRPLAGNPRSETGDVSALVKSIETNGFIGALSVRLLEFDDPQVMEVWAGNRRLKAAQEAGLEEVPCDVYDLTEVQALELNLTEQINRADLTPLEEGEACRRLQELSGYSVAQVAAKLGQSTSWVTKRVALCSLAPEAKTALGKGEVSLTVAQALAALPTQQLQVDGLKELSALEGYPVAEQLDHLRGALCRPLKGATWKLTDELLDPEAGACSKCPHNSGNNTMPGLFDQVKGPPMCARPACFESKLKLAWVKKTEKATAAGAKVLSLAEASKLFPRGGTTLPYACRYVDAHAVVQEDRQKRTWAQLVEEMPGERPLLHVAQDGEGKARDLYVGDKVLAAVATHLKLKWAVKREEAAEEKAERETPAVRDEAKRMADIRAAVVNEVRDAIAKKLLLGPTLESARLLARGHEYAVEDFGAEVVGRKLGAKWLEKDATIGELLALEWWCAAGNEWRSWQAFDAGFLDTAKAHGFDVEKMVAAYIAAPVEAAPKKGGRK